MRTIVLGADDLRNIVAHVGLDALMDEVIECLEHGCEEADTANYTMPVRAGFVDGRGGLLEWMPVMQDSRDATIKVVSYQPDNPRARGLPTILSASLGFDITTGHLHTVCDATFATALRTGAASVVASKVLAIPHAATLGLIGAGAQALAQCHALTRQFPIETVLVYDRDTSVSQSMQRRLHSVGLGDLQVECVAVEEIGERADIVCTATSVGVGEGPVFDPLIHKAHLHINAVGADLPGKTELSKRLLDQSFVATDFIEQALKEGECQQLTREQLGPDITHLLQGAAQYAAKRPQLTVFDSTGFALEDHLVLGVLRRHAQALKAGQFIQLQTIAQDATNPYSFLFENC